MSPQAEKQLLEQIRKRIDARITEIDKFLSGGGEALLGEIQLIIGKSDESTGPNGAPEMRHGFRDAIRAIIKNATTPPLSSEVAAEIRKAGFKSSRLQQRVSTELFRLHERKEVGKIGSGRQTRYRWTGPA